MTNSAFRLFDVSLESSFGGGRVARIDREQATAILDLLEANTFIPQKHRGGPYRLCIGVADARLALHITTEKGAHVMSHYLSLAPFHRLIRDYARICESYYDAIPRSGPVRLEAIDMGRRAIHDDAAALLKERLSSKVTIDKGTARRLFTLIYALLVRETTHTFLSG